MSQLFDVQTLATHDDIRRFGRHIVLAGAAAVALATVTIIAATLIALSRFLHG